MPGLHCYKLMKKQATATSEAKISRITKISSSMYI